MCYQGATLINVRDFGAVGDGIHDDSDAINSAIQTANQTGIKNVYIPGGRYRIAKPIRPEYDGMTIYGDGPGSVILLGFDYIAILVNKGSPPQEIKNLVLRDFAVEATLGKGTTDAGIIQLNNATNMLVENIYIKGNELLLGKRTDGLATSQGTSGLIRNILVENIDKAGIYVATLSKNVEVRDSIVRNNFGPMGGGFSIGGTNTKVVNCQAINNSYVGFILGTVALTDPENGKFGVAGNQMTLLNCFARGSDHGLEISSAYQNVPRNVNVQGFTSDSNRQYGIKIQSGENVRMSQLNVINSGLFGIFLDDVSTGVPGQSPPSGVYVSSSNIVNSGMSPGLNGDIGAVGVRGAPKFTLESVNIETTSANSRQKYGFMLFSKDSVWPKEFYLTGVSVLGLINNVLTYDSINALPQAGRYDIRSLGSPVGRLAAPVNSTYLDVNTGKKYIKKMGYDAGGWAEV